MAERACVPAGGGEMGAAIRAHDWSWAGLPPPDRWPTALKVSLNLMLNSPESMYLLWGPDLIFFFNDAYRPILGPRLEGALGQPIRQLWADAWEAVRPAVEKTMAGVSSRFEDHHITMARYGEGEETWWSYSFSPIHDEAGAVTGVLCFTTETTARVVGARKLELANASLARQVAERTAERERFAQLFEQAPSFMALLTGPEHRIELANPRYMQLVGDRPILGRTFAEALPDAAEQGYVALLDEVFTSGRTYTAAGARYAVQARPGGPVTERYLDFVYQPIVDATGKVTGIFLEGIDVTARTRNLADLHRSEQRVEALMSASSDVFYSLSADWSVMRQLSGKPFVSPIGQDNPNWSADYIHPDERQAVQARVEEAVRTKSGIDLEHRVRTSTGGWAWTLSRVVPVLDDSGEVTEWFGSATDVTALHNALEELQRFNQTLERQVQERTQALKDSLDFTRLALGAVGGVGVWTYDVASDSYVCDAAISEVYGLDPVKAAAGILREEFLANVHPDDMPKLRAAMSGGLRHSGELELEYRIQHPDSSTRWVLSRGHTYSDEQGRPVRRTGVGVDTTKQHHLEEQLRQSQKMEAVGQLTGGIAHDFNNLLTGIIGSLELLKERWSEERYAGTEKLIDAAKVSADRAAALTHRLLAFSRRQTLTPQPTFVNRLVADMEELIRRTIGPRIALVDACASDLWPTLVDPNQLENALLNLCINARDAMPEDGTLTIESSNLSLNHDRDGLPLGDYVMLAVADTGSGMAPDVMAKAFDPFFTTKPVGSGTGLGLSMVYGLVRQSGGEIRIKSKVGQGTQVCLYLPRHRGELQAKAAAASSREAAPAGAGETVLVVDDEATLRMLLREALEEQGYSVLEAGDGASGLEVLRSDTQVDLVISDIGMPGPLNGRQMLDAARDRRPNLKALYITGYAEDAALSQGGLDWCNQVMLKPFSLEALLVRVEELLGKR